MRKYSPTALSPASSTFLSDRQSTINNQATHDARATRARQLFNAKDNAAFREVLQRLGDVSSGGSAGRGFCFYCEHDRKSAIEHTFPLRHYPERSHQFENFLLACSVCNSDKKSDRFAVFDGAGPTYVEFDYRLLGDNPPPTGDPVLLDLRQDEPTRFLHLDLPTGAFVPASGLTPTERARAEYTIRAVGLNDDALPKRRIEYSDMYLHRLRLLADAIASGKTNIADRMIKALAAAIHPTVLFELRRQQVTVEGLPAIIAQIPDDVGA